MIYVSNDFIQNPLISVFIFTYNQEQYIAQTIESILKQKTQYKYEVILVDDCSIDNTKKICQSYQKNYPHLIKFIANDKNKGLIKNYHESISEFCSGKYIAQSAGDDFWCCKDKLEKQVEYLEQNLFIGLVHTQIFTLNTTSNKIKRSTENRALTNFNDLLKNNCIIPVTVCFRRNLYSRFLSDVKPLDKNWVAEDTPMWLWFSLHSEIHYWDNSTAVYRIIPGSASNTTSSRDYFDFIQSRLSIKKYFIQKYSKSEKTLNSVYNNFYEQASFHALKLREQSTIKAISLNHRSNKRPLKSIYFELMSNNIQRRKLYEFSFFIYRLYFKLKKMIE